jgi:putative addiction module component (TIGR02574 family)
VTARPVRTPGACATISSMNSHALDLLKGALALPLDERAELVAELLASMDGEVEADVEAAWGAEIERRARRAANGETEPVAWDAVRDEALKRIDG